MFYVLLPFFKCPPHHGSIWSLQWCEFLKTFCYVIFYRFIIELKDSNDNSMLSLWDPANPTWQPRITQFTFKVWSIMLYSVMYLGSVITSDMFVEVLNERNTILTAIFMPHEPHPYMSLIIQRQTPLCYLMAICKRAYCVKGFTGRCLPPTSIVFRCVREIKQNNETTW